MDRLAAQAQGKWLGGWNANVEADTRAYVDAAKSAGALPVLVAYNIPQRDCGSHSAGGSASGAAYQEWIRAIARGIGANPAAVILEPDAVSGWDCLNAADKATRQKLLADAVAVLKAQPAARVYLDAGHPRWHAADELAARLRNAGINTADGFSLNVSNYITTDENTDFGSKLSSKLGGKHFVIDTSRNGAGPTPDSQWCNPSGRALGQSPTTRTGLANVDAFLWLKTPGESDGACNGGPGAGLWWADYALGLARRAGW
jgi:endoglucanase